MCNDMITVDCHVNSGDIRLIVLRYDALFAVGTQMEDVHGAG